MGTTESGETSGIRPASAVLSLLEKKYGREDLPAVGRLARHIRDANVCGATISHGHVHNILSGDATDITDRTREMPARFFRVPPSRLVPASGPSSSADAQNEER